jgi:hypothetical protein
MALSAAVAPRRACLQGVAHRLVGESGGGHLHGLAVPPHGVVSVAAGVEDGECDDRDHGGRPEEELSLQEHDAPLPQSP